MASMCHPFCFPLWRPCVTPFCSSQRGAQKPTKLAQSDAKTELGPHFGGLGVLGGGPWDHVGPHGVPGPVLERKKRELDPRSGTPFWSIFGKKRPPDRFVVVFDGRCVQHARCSRICGKNSTLRRVKCFKYHGFLCKICNGTQSRPERPKRRRRAPRGVACGALGKHFGSRSGHRRQFLWGPLFKP